MDSVDLTKRIDRTDILCFSHLRWDFVYQRPQHLMSRLARNRRVFFIEEPVRHDGEPGWLFSEVEHNVTRCVPKLPHYSRGADELVQLRDLIRQLVERYALNESIHWFYTPMMIDLTVGLRPLLTVYDCMDELSKFRFAPGNILAREKALFAMADLVFTGGHSLFLAKKGQHHAVHEFPSSIDAAHFRQALFDHEEVPDQQQIPRPRIGYAGVIDERIDLDLIAGAADLRPGWNFVMIGPVVKIEPASLPQRPNIYWLGMKDYKELPRYFAGWNVGMMPFALNESTEFISPTKTPEYLAAGLPVVSTAITDVVRPYGEIGLVEIVSSAAQLVQASDELLNSDKVERLRRVDDFLSGRSWDQTARQMETLLKKAHTRGRPLTSSVTSIRSQPSASIS